jgi:hypothetical protein
MKKEKLSKKEFEELCVKEGIILERQDHITNSTFYLPNLEKIKIMIREFDFLVEGASRGKAINEISKIERYLYKHDKDPNLQNEILATNYSKASIYIESQKDLLTDKNSENWSYIFTKYFSLEDIYNYFHKTDGASTFFRPFRIYQEMVEIQYYIKLMEYLKSQIELFIPLDEDQQIPLRLDNLDFALLVLHKLGVLDTMKEKMKEHYYVSGSKMLTTLLGKSSSNWKSVNDILWDMDHNPDDSILESMELKDKLREVLFHYKLDLR